MKKENIIFTTFILLLIIIPNFFDLYNNIYIKSNSSFLDEEKPSTLPKGEHDPILVIYSTGNQFGDQEYTYLNAFANFSGIIPDLIAVVHYDDPNKLLARLMLDDRTPVADVVMGLDLLSLKIAKENDLLALYNSTELENISETLINYCDPDLYYLPSSYDYLGIHYDADRLSNEFEDLLANFTLSDITKLNLTNQLVLEDPLLNIKGLEFLLWTIAVYGDPLVNFEGLLGINWREWWRTNIHDITFVPSPEEAYLDWTDAEQNQMFKISKISELYQHYASVNQSNQKILFSHENNQANALMHIEGIGLVGNKKPSGEGEMFIDWYLSEQTQTQMSLDTWKIPVNNEARVNPAVANYTQNNSNIHVLNDILDFEIFTQYVDNWTVDWENLFSDQFDWDVIDGFGKGIFVFSSLLGIFILIFHAGDLKKKRDEKNDNMRRCP